MLNINKNIIFILVLIPFWSLAQEDLASKEEMLVEQQHITFETFFFEALQQKAIGNYDKAIYALEECQDIDAENVAVLFEFSKNYYESNKYTEAEFYGIQALSLEPKNLYIIRHLKEVCLKKNDYKGAIKYQEYIIEQVPEEESDLIFLFIRGGDVESAKILMKKLEYEERLPESFDSLKESLFQENRPPPVVKNNSTILPIDKVDQLKESYKTNGDYNTLKQILERELKTKQYLLLLEDSNKALSLYPSQPYIYFMNGLALNKLRKYNAAIEVLDNGLEFVFDDPKMESQYMEELSLSYKGLGQNKKSTMYYNKMLELRKTASE